MILTIWLSGVVIAYTLFLVNAYMYSTYWEKKPIYPVVYLMVIPLILVFWIIAIVRFIYEIFGWIVFKKIP